MFRVTLLFPIIGVTLVTALQHYDQYSEGSCSSVQPTKANREFVDSLRYIPAGSKYHMYRSASSIPDYLYLSEKGFTENACYSRNTTTTQFDSVGSVFGFGRVLRSVRVVTRPGIYFEGINRHPLTNTVGFTNIVTLTDNKSFAFLVVCWTGAALNEQTWAVVSNTPSLDAKTRKLIEEHAVSLGFKREHFVYLTYRRCFRDDNALDAIHSGRAPAGPLRY